MSRHWHRDSHGDWHEYEYSNSHSCLGDIIGFIIVIVFIYLGIKFGWWD